MAEKLTRRIGQGMVEEVALHKAVESQADIAKPEPLKDPSLQNINVLKRDSFYLPNFIQSVKLDNESAPQYRYFDVTDTLVRDEPLINNCRVFLTFALLKELLIDAELVPTFSDPRTLVDSFITTQLFNKLLDFRAPYYTGAEESTGKKGHSIDAGFRRNDRTIVFHLRREILPPNIISHIEKLRSSQSQPTPS